MAKNDLTDNYDRIYIEVLDYLGRNFEGPLSNLTIHAEHITNIAKRELEEAIEEWDEVETSGNTL